MLFVPFYLDLVACHCSYIPLKLASSSSFQQYIHVLCMRRIPKQVFGASHDAQASSAAQSWAAAYPQGQENGTYARPRRQQDDLLRRRRRRLMSSSSPSSSDSSTTSRKPGRRTGKSDKPAAWLPGAKLRAEVEVRAPGALGSGAAGGLRASVPLVVIEMISNSLSSCHLKYK